MSFHGGFRGGFTRGFQSRLEKPQPKPKPMPYCSWRNEEEYHRERIKRERARERRRQLEAERVQAREQAETKSQILRELGRDPKPARQRRWEEYEPFELALDPEIRSQLGLDWPALPDEEEWLSGFGHRGRSSHQDNHS